MSLKVGGQAVIEGVMMRSGDQMAIAVRKPDRQIYVHKETLLPAGKKYPLLKLPVLRGMVAFVEALVIGTRSLTISAGHAYEEEEEELSGWQLTFTVLAAITLAVLLFFVLPTIAVRIIAAEVAVRPLWLNLLEGFIRIAVFLSYIVLVSRLKDIQRVFAYHGAEHKAIACYEAGEPLTVRNAGKHKTVHPRCGTSFLLLVMAVSVLLFSFFGWPSLWQRLLLRLLLLPLVAGISYEIIQLAGKYRFFCFLTTPGLWLQRLTTREPDDRQIEVAIRALQSVLPEEKILAEV